ncbi:MAG TPA: DEAD/DEAH box helicase, partial [Thermomicrobiales bacterium]|nr:DEAD/DEAH box helicase [Thermomicrobiales bacterium]
EERTIWDLVVLDEASQISIPEFLVATTGLHPNGTMIVVGDHRQMPPIVHTIDPDDPTLAIDPFPVYRSLFDLIRIRDDDAIASIKFSRSFRIHRDVAEFLRRAIYSKDDIALHSLRRDILGGPTSSDTDLGVAIAASPCAIVLVCHNEASSQQKNPLEIDIALSAIKAISALDSEASIGIVVPHRAQRAALRELILHETGDQRLVERVDTVERFQGDERDVIIFSATESDPIYLQAAGGFLFDPRRFNVAISRAKRKLIVVASRELFAAIPKDIAEFENAEIWQMLHQDICTEPIWQGVVAGYNVECRGSSGLLDSAVEPG